MKGKEMKVYTVSRGECHQGGEVQKIFSTLESARAHCLNEISQSKEAWKEMLFCEWVTGCDFMIVEKFKVEA